MSRACFETPSDGLADVIQRLGLRASLGDAAGNGRALSDEHAGLVGFQRHEQLHTWILLQMPSLDWSQRRPGPALWCKRASFNVGAVT